MAPRAAAKRREPAEPAGQARPGWLPPVHDPRAEAVLLAAFDVFMEHGYEGATMLEIATRAKVSKLTLYALFTDKEGLFEALVAWGAQRYQLDAEALSALAAAQPREALERYALAFARVMLRWQSIALFRIAVSQAAKRPRMAAVHDELTRKERQSTLAPLMQRLVDGGLIADADREDFARDFQALMRGDIYYDVLVGRAEAPSKEAVEAHVKRALARLLKAYAQDATAPPSATKNRAKKRPT